jgi:two-component system sensor histidine kinase FlrB
LDTTETQLAEAFDIFNALSMQLETSYRHLEQRVAHLTDELSAARNERLQQLREKEKLANQLTRILDALPGGVVVVGGTERVVEANPAACEFLGERPTGEFWTDITRRAFVDRSRDGREARLKDGRRLSLSSRSLVPESGYIVLLQDVTETRALQAKGQHQKRLAAMGRVAASLAHQIRTPLATVLLYVSQLAQPELSQQRRLALVSKMRRRLHHLERVICDMLIYARGGFAGSEQIKVRDLLEDVRQTMAPQARDLAADLKFHVSGRLPDVKGNREVLVSAINNLVANALQAGGRGVHVEVLAENSQGRLRLYVKDNGPGISDAADERIFEPFFSGRSNGTGLGLAIVKAVADAHKGSVDWRSDPGLGCTFILDLPGAESGDVSDTVTAVVSGNNNRET